MKISDYMPSISAVVDCSILILASNACKNNAMEKAIFVYEQVIVGKTPVDKGKVFTASLLAVGFYLAAFQLLSCIGIMATMTHLKNPFFPMSRLLQCTFTWL